jgi:hypothetical protein
MQATLAQVRGYKARLGQAHTEIREWIAAHPGGDPEEALIGICAQMVPFGRELLTTLLEEPALLDRPVLPVVAAGAETAQDMARRVVAEALFEQVNARLVGHPLLQRRPQLRVVAGHGG